MSFEDTLQPEVRKFIDSFPPRKRITTDVEHFPFEVELHCFYCGLDRKHYRAGIFESEKGPEKNYKKWVVWYDCDLCKTTRYFKYIPPEEEFKFLPTKYPF